MPNNLKQRIDLELDSKNVDKGLSKVERRASRTNNLFARMAALLGGVASAATIANVAKLTARFEDLETSLAAIEGSARAGKQAMKEIRIESRTTQFAVDQLANTHIKLRAAGIEPTVKVMKFLTDTAAITTDQVGSLTAGTDLLARTVAGGLGLEDLNRLADRGAPLFQILKDKMGLSRLEIAEFGKTSEGAAKLVKALMEGVSERFGGATERRLNNISTLFSNLKISISESGLAAGDASKGGLKDLLKGLTELSDATLPYAKALGEILNPALKGLGDGARFASNHLAKISIIGGGLLTLLGAKGLAGLFGKAARGGRDLTKAQKGTNKVLGTFKTLLGLIPAGRVVSLIVKLTTVAGGLALALTGAKGVTDSLEKSIQWLKDFGGALVEQDGFIKDFVDGLKSIVKWLDETITSYNRLANEINKGNAGLDEDHPLYGLFKQGQDAVLTPNRGGTDFHPVKLLKPTIKETFVSAGMKATELAEERAALGGHGTNVGKRANIHLRGTGVDDEAIKTATKKQKEALENLKKSLMTEEELIRSSFKERNKIIDEALEANIISNADAEEQKIRLKEETNAKLAELDQAEADRKAQIQENNMELIKAGQFSEVDLTESSQEEKKALVTQAGKDILAEAAKYSRTAFEANKALNIASAIMDTQAGIAKAWSYGPILGPAMAAIVAASGFAAVGSIASTQYQGRVSGGPTSPHMATLTGEDGPEISGPGSMSQVLNARKLREMIAGRDITEDLMEAYKKSHKGSGGNHSSVLNMNVNATGLTPDTVRMIEYSMMKETRKQNRINAKLAGGYA